MDYTYITKNERKQIEQKTNIFLVCFSVVIFLSFLIVSILRVDAPDPIDRTLFIFLSTMLSTVFVVIVTNLYIVNPYQEKMIGRVSDENRRKMFQILTKEEQDVQALVSLKKEFGQDVSIGEWKEHIRVRNHMIQKQIQNGKDIEFQCPCCHKMIRFKKEINRVSYFKMNVACYCESVRSFQRKQSEYFHV